MILRLRNHSTQIYNTKIQNMKFIATTAYLFIGFVLTAKAQTTSQKIGENPTVKNEGAVLELESANKGVLFPRVALSSTTAWGLAGTATRGMLVYNTKTTTDGFTGSTQYPVAAGDGTGLYFWVGTGWAAAARVSASGADLTKPSLPNIEIDNANGLSLQGSVRLTNTLKFTSGHLFLNNFNVILDNDASFLGTDASKHIVTNGTGVVVKENLATGASFLFPVSVAGSDYTPATVTNEAAARNINVQVKDYAASAATESVFANKGMDRTWQVSSNMAGIANISLQHNSADNANGTSTNQSAFNNAQSYVAQQTAPGVWLATCKGSDGGSPISINFGAGFIIPDAVDATAFFTKRTVECADLSVEKTVSNASAAVGANVVFAITAKNLGPAGASGVKVEDLLPSGYTLVSANVSAGSYNAATGLWSIGSLANGASATLTVTATINSSGNYSNTAIISGDQTDPNMGNNTSTVTLSPGAMQTNLAVVKTVNNMTPAHGSTVVFTITASNKGPNNATRVKVEEMLPDGYVFMSASATKGSYDLDSLAWNIGDMLNGATEKLEITAAVKRNGSYTNTVRIFGVEPDPELGNNTSTVTPLPNAEMVDLSVLKTATMSNTYVGQEFTYIIQVKNISSHLATGVIVKDILPEQLTYMGYSGSYGKAVFEFATKTVAWDVGELAAGATVELIIKVKATKAGMIANTATVNSTETDVDMANNNSTHTGHMLDLHIPNIITPDGDGKNDTFKIPGLEAYPENSLMLFNRWGNEVWKTSGRSYKNEWDGRGLNDGTYYYILKIKDETGSWQTFSGWVTLLRN
jgi:uncharacterized repeat protein (TIGR01451 family)/gliding motility-associated-like protein